MARSRDNARNVLGTPLEVCGNDPVTGFYRNGCCDTGQEDAGMHVVCAVMTEEFLKFSRQRGNDLITPRPGFAGLHAGDPWCLCAMRWLEAYRAGVAPPVLLTATHENALKVVPMEALETHALHPPCVTASRR
jgi:uncharacterized protein (DUF2237 family)